MSSVLIGARLLVTALYGGGVERLDLSMESCLEVEACLPYLDI